MSQEVDEACARALGWPLDGIVGYEARVTIPAFSTEHAAARLLEDEIERRGEQAINAYMAALVESCIGGTDGWGVVIETTLDRLFLLLRATPEQRARAFLEAIKQ